MKSKKKNSTSANNKKASSSSSNNKHLICEDTGDKVFCATATLSDIRHPPTSQKRRVLYKVPSAKIRHELYDELALCLEDRESRLLPKYGGRPWQVLCRVQDAPKGGRGSPFFRWHRGKLELAVLPHILEKIPDPPSFPGYQQTDFGVVRRLIKPKRNNNNPHSYNNSDDDSSESEEEEEEQYDNLTPEEIQRMESLVGREVSVLSQVSWDHRNNIQKGAPLPTISIKWTCPLRQTFTSRKAAWDHALELAKAEQFVDRFLRGLGKTGVELKPFRPTRAQALQAGKVRFLRDGLWVVGQEQHWQNGRYLAIAHREQRAQEEYHHQQQQQQEEEHAEQQESGTKRQAIVVDEHGEALKKRRKITGPQLYVAVHRVAFREHRLKELKKELESQPKKKAKEAKSEEEGTKEETVDDSNQNDNSNNAKPTKVSKTAAKVGSTLR